MLGPMRGISRRTQPGKSAKVVDEMGLIEVTALQCDIRPIHIPAHPHLAQHSLEAPHAAVQFRRQPNLVVEHIDKTP